MLKLFNFISELMESKLKSFSCQAHLSEYIARATFDTSSSKALFCVEWLLEIKPTFKVLSLVYHFNQFLELRKSLPNFTSANADTSEGVPDEIKGFLSSESDY